MEDIQLEKSCKTVVFEKSDLFISALPGKIVFGEVSEQKYLKFQYFKFMHFEIFHLYLALVNILKYLVNNENQDKGLILQLDANLLYFWQGKNIIKNDIQQKIIVFGIEYNSNIIYELLFDCGELNCLIKYLPNTIFASLCLKSSEKDLFEKVTKESTSVIVSLNSTEKCHFFLKTLKNDQIFLFNCLEESNFVDLLIHYNELLIIIQKLKSMYNPDVENRRRIDAILQT